MPPTALRIVIVVAFVVMGVLAGDAPVQAAGSATGHAAVAAVPTGCCSPTSTIEGTGKTRKFAPKMVTGFTVSHTCSPEFFSFAIVNDTKRSQQLMYKGSQLGAAIKPTQTRYLCFSAVGEGVISLKGDPRAKLDFSIV